MAAPTSRNLQTDKPPRTAHEPPSRVPPLESGDRLTADEFERRYDAMPDLKRAELIEGVVFVASPVSEDHAGPHLDLATWAGLYRGHTPGVTGGADGTIRLDLKNRPQPDVYLRVLESHGGQARLSPEGFVVGAPEFTAEVAASSASHDLHDKAEVYRRNRVQEYLVWRVHDRAIDWWSLSRGRYRPLRPQPDGTLRGKALPGLWLDPNAMLAGDLPRVIAVLQRGLASPEHARFVEKLQRAAQGP